MATIEEMYEAFKSVELRESLPIIIQETEPIILELVQEQLNQGIDGLGNTIQPDYFSPEYAKVKNQMNARPGYGIPDLKYTGNLYKQMFVDAYKDTFTIDSKADYAHDKSIEQYGEQLMGMNDETIEKYCDETLMPEIAKYITSKTGVELI